MSEYVSWLNQIKSQADVDWLTTTQRDAYISLTTRWQASPFVSLFGAGGSGKTFIARLIAKELSAAHLFDASEISQVPEGTAHIILDGVEYTRSLRPEVAARRIRRVILIGRHRPVDQMPGAELTLSLRDVSQFQSTLFRYGIVTHFTTNPDSYDLDHLLRQEAVRRAELL